MVHPHESKRNVGEWGFMNQLGSKFLKSTRYITCFFLKHRANFSRYLWRCWTFQTTGPRMTCGDCRHTSIQKLSLLGGVTLWETPCRTENVWCGLVFLLAWPQFFSPEKHSYIVMIDYLYESFEFGGAGWELKARIVYLTEFPFERVLGWTSKNRLERIFHGFYASQNTEVVFFCRLDWREAANEWEQSPGLVLGSGGHLLDGRFFPR